MQTLHTIAALQSALEPHIEQTIALVPTMGNLHQGHLSLVEKAKQYADIVVVSIFVNPLQFGENEDLDSYPRTLQEDQEKLQACGANYLFTPNVEEIYPFGQAQQTQVSVPGISAHHCGASRPGHFDGVSTVVCKLLNIVQPDVALFGEKDFQQLAVIRKMVADLCMPIQIISVETCRDSSGLALSSRNNYLNVTERNIAPLLFETLQHCKAAILAQQDSTQAIRQKAVETLENKGFKVDYFNIADAQNLEDVNPNTESVVILVAAFLGNTRLIDNIHFPLNH